MGLIIILFGTHIALNGISFNIREISISEVKALRVPGFNLHKERIFEGPSGSYHHILHWIPEQLFFQKVGSSIKEPITGIPGLKTEVSILQGYPGIYAYASFPGFNDKNTGAYKYGSTTMYQLDGSVATPVLEYNKLTPRCYQTTQGVYCVSTNLKDKEFDIYKLSNKNLLLIGTSTMPDVSTVHFNSNSKGEAYATLGHYVYKIDDTKLIPIIGIVNDARSFGSSYFNTKVQSVEDHWYITLTDYGHNRSMVYKLDGVVPTQLEGLNDFADSIDIETIGSTTYALASKTILGFCGDSVCNRVTLFSIDNNKVNKIISDVSGTQTTFHNSPQIRYGASDDEVPRILYSDKRGYLYAPIVGGTIMVIKDGKVFGKISNFLKDFEQLEMYSDNENTYATIFDSHNSTRKHYRINLPSSPVIQKRVISYDGAVRIGY